MTNKQRQHLLAYLGHYEGPADGLWGPLSEAACRVFQEKRGLHIDGRAGEETDEALKKAVSESTFWDEIAFFDREEFRCQCGGKYCNGFPVEPQEKMVRTVNEIRRRLGVPVQIVTAGGSGVRCPQHNTNVGGVANSLHLTGNAADLHSGKSPREMYAVAEEVLGNTGELGLYDWGIHVGLGKYSRFNG